MMKRLSGAKLIQDRGEANPPRMADLTGYGREAV